MTGNRADKVSGLSRCRRSHEAIEAIFERRSEGASGRRFLLRRGKGGDMAEGGTGGIANWRVSRGSQPGQLR